MVLQWNYKNRLSIDMAACFLIVFLCYLSIIVFRYAAAAEI